MSFDMPKTGTWEQRGGWVVNRLMVDLGLADYQAAGLVGNLGFESVGFRTLQEMSPMVAGSAGGFGWAQWTGPRRRTFNAWCVSKHLPVASDEANYGYLLAELRGEIKGQDFRNTVTALKRCSTIEAAVFSVGQTYERPAGTTLDHLPGNAERLTFARRALAGAKASAIVASDPAGEPVGDMPTALSPDQKIKAIQLVLGVKQDGQFGPISRGAFSKVLQAAGQPGI